MFLLKALQLRRRLLSVSPENDIFSSYKIDLNDPTNSVKVLTLGKQKTPHQYLSVLICPAVSA